MVFQGANNTVVPMVTDTIRSNIQFGEGVQHSPAHSPKNGSASSTPSRGEPAAADLCESNMLYKHDAQRNACGHGSGIYEGTIK